jgi:hypothetical protein
MNAVKTILVFSLVAAHSLFAVDTGVKIVQHLAGAELASETRPSFEITVYVHNAVQRVDYVGYPVGFIGARTGPAPHTAIITHCDTRVVYELDFDKRVYRKLRLHKFPDQERLARAIAQDQKETQAVTVDTGETRDFQGRTAKHLVTTIKGIGDSTRGEVVDGWYLNVPDPGCLPEYMRRLHAHTETIGDLDDENVYERGFFTFREGVHADFWYNWFLPAGFAVQLTSSSPAGLATQATSNSVLPVERRIVEFSEGPLDPALFVVPPGFKKLGVRDFYRRDNKR